MNISLNNVYNIREKMIKIKRPFTFRFLYFTRHVSSAKKQYFKIIVTFWE